MNSDSALSARSFAVEGFDPSLVSTHRDEPTLRMCKQDILNLAQPIHNALVGRFSYSRPPMDVIRIFFLSLGPNDECAVGLLDYNHVLIWSMVEEDYTRLFVRRTWYI